jgi:uncharacterized protein (TIGR03032 family)
MSLGPRAIEESATGDRAADVQPLRSVHTANFPALLDELGISLVVTTYQAGKLVFLRPDQGKLNTHFRDMPAPMGLALHENRLAIGGPWCIWEFQNVPAVTRKLEPAGRHDACFLPRHLHVTGNVLIHEMAWAAPQSQSLSPEGAKVSQPELWFVNTRFSCLCTRDLRHSFLPRWRPPFVTALAGEDRCHLNGLGLVDGKPRYVTALGVTNSTAGWRDKKRDGGVLLEVPGGDIVAGGLSMPHSPRWYADRLWVLESGCGGLGVVDLKAGRYRAVITLPGFARGLDFFGPLAFVGLSQVRDTAVFSDIPITEPARERHCGIWVVDIRSGQTVAFVRFDGQLQEIFGVQVLPRIRYPELINDGRHEVVADSFVLPDEALRLASPEFGPHLEVRQPYSFDSAESQAALT